MQGPCRSSGSGRVRVSTCLGEEAWTKRNKKTGKFMDQKKAPAKKKFKGVRREKKAA